MLLLRLWTGLKRGSENGWVGFQLSGSPLNSALLHLPFLPSFWPVSSPLSALHRVEGIRLGDRGPSQTQLWKATRGRPSRGIHSCLWLLVSVSLHPSPPNPTFQPEFPSLVILTEPPFWVEVVLSSRILCFSFYLCWPKFMGLSCWTGIRQIKPNRNGVAGAKWRSSKGTLKWASFPPTQKIPVNL